MSTGLGTFLPVGGEKKKKEGKGHGAGFLDRIDALRVLRADDDSEKSRILEQIGVHGPVERQLMIELARTAPVQLPDDFGAATRTLMRAIEVLERNGAQKVEVRSTWGPLRPVFGFLVQLVTRWIVKSHINRVAMFVRQLYERREASAVRGSPEHRALRRARKDMARVEQGLRSDRLKLPTFLLGGAFLTGALSAVLSGVVAATRNVSLLVVLALVTVVLLIVLSWVSIYAAAVARHRIRLTTDWALTALYQAIGAAGRPPRDHSYNLAIVAITFMLAAILVLPVATWLFIERVQS